jgi:hypothetical protein
MDDLLMLAGELAENNNFKNDNFQEDTKPDGDYAVVLESLKLKTSDSTGTEWFGLVLKVIEGDYIEEKFYVNLFLTEKTIKRTLTILMRLLASMGYEVDVTMFSDKNTIVDGLQPLVGEQTILSKTTSKNGFVNYSFKGGEE